MQEATLLDIFCHIDHFENETINTPIMYSLQPIKWIYPEYEKIQNESICLTFFSFFELT